MRLGLRTKFFLYSNSVIVVTASLVAFLWIVHARRASYDATVHRAIDTTKALAVPIARTLGNTSHGPAPAQSLVQEYIDGLFSNHHPFFKYAVVCDRRGRVLFSNRNELVGQSFPRALGPEALGAPPRHEILLDTNGRKVLEVRMPLQISGATLGCLATGFSLAPVEATMETVGKRAILVALLLILGNSIVTAIYVETLIRPILALNATMKRAGKGDLSVRADERRSDEVGELGRAFNHMMNELEKAQEAARVQATQLAHTEKMAAVGTLAAGVAHEINNPLAGIMNCVESMIDNPEDVELRRKYLDLTHDGLRRIERIVHNLLDFSRPREPRPELTSLNHCINHVIELVDYQLSQGEIQVHMDLQADGAMVLADHFQMEQLLLNLVLNAITAMPEGGVLTLRTRTKRSEVTAEVCDTGIGIPEEVRQHIFDPFFTTHELGKGTGLGLAVSRRIVQAHGGRIEVESEAGEGTIMRVVIPHRPDRELREDNGGDTV